MDSMQEQRLLAAQHDQAAEQAEEREQACAWAAEQGMLADEEWKRMYGREQP